MTEPLRLTPEDEIWDLSFPVPDEVSIAGDEKATRRLQTKLAIILARSERILMERRAARAAAEAATEGRDEA